MLKGIVHERSDVRLHALRALHKLLTSNRVRWWNTCMWYVVASPSL